MTTDAAMRGLIRHCRLGEGCHQTWGSLTTTSEKNVRWCTHCRENVHAVTKASELWNELRMGHCVAILSAEMPKESLWLGYQYSDRSDSGLTWE